jgi:cyanophycinase
MRLRHLLCSVLFAGIAMNAFAAGKSKPAYQYFRVGNTGDVSRATTAGTVLMGGGTDVDAAFQWMCSRSGGGDFLVIRATGTDAYNPYIQQLCPSENSVSTLIIPTTTAANDPFVLSTINAAEAIFIAGGNQADYINFWTGTPVQSALNNAIQRGVPIGGTSAGMNVLTKFVYTALLPQGVTSSQALANPYNKYITLGENFVTITSLPAMIGDPHFVTRDRMGRDLAFLCRIWNNNWSNQPRAVDVDEQTALLVDGSGNATIVGASTAYFLQAPGAPQVCASGTPLTYQNIGVYRISATSSPAPTFNFATWQGTGGNSYTVSANAGALSSTQAGGNIY